MNRRRCSSPLTPHFASPFPPHPKRLRHLSSTELPPVTPGPPTSGRRPPNKSHPRAPSPHHGPDPRIDSLHPRPCCPPTELHAPPPPLVDVGAPPSSHHPYLPPVRIPKVSSPFSPTHGEEIPAEPAARCYSGEPFAHAGHRSMVDQ
jgi:hypothetical protein